MGRESPLPSLLAALVSAGAVLLLAAAAPGPAIDPGGRGGSAALRVRAWPWARVRVDRGPWFLTPLARPIPLSPGEHRVVAEHPVLGRVERTVAAAPGTRLELVLTLPARDGTRPGDPVPSPPPAGAELPGSPGSRERAAPRTRIAPPPRGPGVRPGAPPPAEFPVRQLLARRRAGRAAACLRLARLLLGDPDTPPAVRAAAVRHGAWALLALGREEEAAAWLARAAGRTPGLAPDPRIDPPRLVALWPVSAPGAP